MTSELSTSSLNAQIALLPAPARKDFHFWRERIEPLLGEKQKGICAALASIAVTTGRPLKTVQMKYYRAKNRGLLALVDKRLAGPAHWKSSKQLAISNDDQELVKLYAGKNQRSTRSAVKQLRRDWQRGNVKTETPIDP